MSEASAGPGQPSAASAGPGQPSGATAGSGSMNTLDAWVHAATRELGLNPAVVETKQVLDVARDVAHQVIRPGAPVTTYLMGVAVGRGADPADVAERLQALALRWETKDA